MVLLKSENIPLGVSAPEFELGATDGGLYSLQDFAAAKVLVIVFMCNHCPYVKAILENLIALAGRFAGADVQFVGINPNTANSEYRDEETMEKMKEVFLTAGMNFPYLEDKDQKVAKAYGAICTPDIFVYGRERKLAYHGRADELGGAIAALIDGDSVAAVDQKPSQGCSIKWV